MQARFLFCNKRTVGDPQRHEALSASQRFGIVPQAWLESQLDSRFVTAFKGLENFKLVEPDDFVISLRSFQGGIEHSAHEGLISPAYTVMRPLGRVGPHYYRHYLKSNEFISRLNAVTTGIREGKTIKYDEFAQLELPVPPRATQAAIADFLDRKTAAIDALIEKKERMIELLGEKRAALVHRAVTKGLDPNVPMKDSGVPWIGEIPAHWKLSKVKNELENLNYRRIPLSTSERNHRQGPYPYYGASGIIDSVDDYIFDETAILIAEDGANLVLRNLPLAIVARGKYWVNNHAHILRVRSGLVTFWANLVEILDYRPFISGSAQPKLTSEALGNIQVGIPGSLEEGLHIEAALARVGKEYSVPIERTSLQVQRLKEYRQALITQAVTGQLEIPDAA
ncbi:MAG: restriction endonuclease subunit S [Acidobacteriota bacterium]